jgi:ERCC4-type nuclease
MAPPAAGDAKGRGLRAVEIALDVRERALSDALDACGVTYASRSLDVGDVAFYAEARGAEPIMVVERKTLADLAASIKDGRYKEQKSRLLSSVPASAIVYLLEVGAPSAFSFDARMRHSHMAPSLQGAVCSLLVGYGFRVVMTRDVAETAAFLKRAADRLATTVGEDPRPADARSYASAACEASIKVKKRDNVDARQCFLQQLCQIPGVSAKLAATLAAEFGCMRRLYSEMLPLSRDQRVKRLASLSLIGVKSGGRIHDYLFGGGGESDFTSSGVGGGPGVGVDSRRVEPPPERGAESGADAGVEQVVRPEVRELQVEENV